MTKKTDAKESELFAPLSETAEMPTAKQPAKKKDAQVITTNGASLMTSNQQSPPAAPRSMLEVIIAAVRDPACDVEKMKALLEMQRDIEQRDAQKAFTRAFNALQADLPVITKDGLIDHGDGTTAKGNKKLKTRFATYPNIMAVCKPLLKAHGFTLSNVIEPSGDGSRIHVVGYLEHIDGHSRISRFPLGIDTSAGKNNLQGWGSSQTYGQRYNCIALLNIVSEAPQDQDNDGHAKREADATPANISKAQAEELRLVIEDAGLPEEKFLEKYKLDHLDDLPAKLFAEAKKDVAAFKRKAAEGRAHG